MWFNIEGVQKEGRSHAVRELRFDFKNLGLGNGYILASGIWERDRPVTVNCIVEGMEMGVHKSGSHMVSSLLHGRRVGDKSQQVVCIAHWRKDAVY